MMGLLHTRYILICLVYAKIHECSNVPTEKAMGAVYFQPNTEYVFLLESTADFDSARLEGLIKIGLTRVSDLANDTGQEIHLNIHTMDLTSGGHRAMIHDEQDLTKWFSVKMRHHGVIFEVVYPYDEDLEIVNIKKNIAGMFSGHLDFKGQEEGHGVWEYHTRDIGTEGHHRSSYTATMSNEKTIFRKKRLTQPIEHGNSVHEKEIHFHPHLGISDKIKINERYDAPSKLAPGFDAYAGMPIAQSEDTKLNNQKDFPAMSATSESEITFLYSRETLTPVYPSIKLVKDSLQIKSVPPDMAGFNQTGMWSFIRGNLTCMRKDIQKDTVSVQATYCFQKLVYLLLHIPKDNVDEIISSFFPEKNTKRLRDTIDRLSMLDSLMATNSEYIQDALTNAVFLTVSPDKYILERFLMLSIANNKTISKHFVAVLQTFVFQPELFPKSMNDQSLKRTAVMALGAIASRLSNIDRHKEAIRIVTKLEDTLGINDPWEYNSQLGTISTSLYDEHHFNTAAMVEALGNAGFARSFDHIVSYLNSTDIPSILRRAGLHSLRNFQTKEAADILLSASEADDDKQVRKLANHLYQAHAYGNKMNESYSLDNSMETKNISEVDVKDRQRRSIANKVLDKYLTWEFPFNSDAVLWKSGNDKLGASIGYRLRNNFKIKVRLLNGVLEIDALNNAFVRLHVGILGFNLDVASADQCFDGAIEIRINPFKEIKCAVVEQFLNAFDRVIQHYLRKLAEAIEDFTDWVLGPEGLPLILEDFGEALESIPQKAYDALHKVNDALQRISGMSQGLLSPVINPVSDLVLRIAQFVQDFQKDMTEFYNAISDAIVVILHSAFEQLIRAIQVISDNTRLAEIVTSPHTAIENIYKALVNSGIATDAILQVKQILEKAGILGEGPSPHWRRTLQNCAILQDEVSRLKSWVNEQILDLFGGNRRRRRGIQEEQIDIETIHNEVSAILDDVWVALDPLKHITDPIHLVANRFFDSTRVLKRLYQNLRNSYLDTKSEIVKILGPNVHPDFPREMRLDGNGCESNGFYPSTADGFYEDQGVDLVTKTGQMIVSPYSGSVSVTNGQTKRIRLVPSDGGFINTVIYIDNIEPNNNIPVDGFINIIAGTPLGIPSKNGPCGSRHIHFVVKTELDPKPYNQPRDQRSTSNDRRSGIHDSSMYLNNRLLEIRAYKRGCDDFTVKILGFSLIKGRLTQDFHEKDISPEHNVDLTWLFDRRKRSTSTTVTPYSSPAWFDSKSVTSIIKDLGLPIPDFGNPYPVGFNFNNLRTGSVLNFFKGLVGNDIADRMTNVLKSLVILLTDTPCVNPTRLTKGQLVRELYKRGESINGTREDLIGRYLNPDNRCPLLQLSLPANTYCHIDPTCLAVECCINIPFLFQQISLKSFIRYNPCDSTLVLGIHPWKISLDIQDPDLAVEQEIVFDIDLKELGQQHAKLSYTLEKTKDLFLVSFSFSICEFDGECSIVYQVFKQLAFMVPTCDENKILFWDKVDVLEYLQRTHVSTLLAETGYERSQLNVDHIANALGISPEIISNLPKCRRPETLTHNELEQTLQRYGESTQGTTTELLNRLSIAMNSCENIVLSSLPSFVSERMNCFMSPDCGRVECCLSVDVFGYTPSFRIFMEIQACNELVAVGFENAVSIIHLEDVTQNGIADELTFGWVQLRYAVRMTAVDEYLVSFEVAVCPTNSDCIFDTRVVENGKFNIYPCDVSSNDDELTGTWFRQKRQTLGNNEELNYEGNKFDNRYDDSIQFWRERLGSGNTTFTSEENMSITVSKISKDAESKPGTVTGALPLTSILKGHQQEQAPLPVDNVLNLLMDEQTMWPGISVIGGDFTATGISILTNLIMESELSTIQSLIDAQELHQMKSVVDTSLALMESLNDIDFAEIIQQLQQILRELIEINIDDILYLDLPTEFQARDFIINAVARIPESGRMRITLLEKTFPIPLGFVTLEFYAGIGAGISIEIPFSLTVGTMTYQIGITPGVAVVGWAGLGIRIFIFRLSFEFEIELLGNDVPISRETNYCKFPIEVTDRVDLVVTPLVLRLYIKIQIKVWIFKTTIYKKELWKWSSPSIRFNLKKKVTYKYDTTIPDLFESIVNDSLNISDEDKRRCSIETVTCPESTKSCFVHQIPGLDYTEPAFYIEVAASDDISYVTYSLSVGTEPGGNELVYNEVFGGPSAVVTKPLKSGVPLYFSIRVKNSAGGIATATCHLPTFDTTKPGGRLDAAFMTTSHPNLLKASAVLHEDSEIAERRASVGYGSGIWGDQVVSWEAIDSGERENVASNTKDEFGYFTTPRIGRLVSVPVATYSHLNPNFCARDCLALPASKCLSFNYDFGPDNTCELLEEIEGHGVELHQSGLFSHFERLGVGHAIEIDHNNLQLDHNNLYYFNVYTNNILGYESVISSKGILTDFTIPNPGLIRNAKTDDVLWQDCIEFVPEEWQQRCTITTTLPNHRVIEDGQESQTVFNGHVDFVDLLYTRANKFISANWDGFYDNETGIYGYTWSVGSDVCMDDVSSHIDPHSHLFDESEWTHEGIVTGVYLEDGYYFITVRALNKVEFGGPMAVSVCHTTPYVIDTTPPAIYSIYNVTYDSEEYLIGVNVNSTDKESGILRHDFALGRTPRDIDILPWKHRSNSDFIDMQFRIPDGIPAWVKIRAVNNVNLTISSHSDTALFVDMSPPDQGIVTDGIDGHDLKYFKNENTICASWKDFNDPESGISSYLWYVGTYPGGTDVVNYITVQHDAHFACSDTASLQHNETYFSTVVAFNGGIDKLNASGLSNGVTLDVTPPVIGYVFDGIEDEGADLVYSSQSASVASFWGNFTDPESGIDNYKVSVHRKGSTNENKDDEILHISESVGEMTHSIEWHHFHLHHNDFVYVKLRTINGAENFIDTNSNGYLIDLTPPVLQTIGDGRLLNSDIEFQKNTNQIAANWIYADEESGILYYQLAIYELKHGTKKKIFPSDDEENSFKTIKDGATTVNIQDNLLLEPGAIYTTLVKAINGAKLVSSHETTGIRIDPSPPKMIFVRAGSVDGDHEELLNGYVYQSDRLGIMASWRAVDPESRIKSYWVAVGTKPHTSDITDFRSLGADHSSYISGLELSLSNECQQECQPVYYVCVKAENGAGEFSDDVCSSPVKVVPADKTGYVTDGPAEVSLEAEDPSIADIDTQYNGNTITVTFAGFESIINGIGHYEWAIGTTPEGEDVQPFMSDGIVLDVDENAVGLPGSGKAQALVDLEQGKTYYATMRALTGSGDILESSTDGVTVDQTPPDVTLFDIGLHDFSNGSKQWDVMAPVYQSDGSSLTAMWSAEDSESNVDIVYYSVGTYPGGNDVSNNTVTEVNYIPFGDVRPNLIGQPNKLQIEAINTAGIRRNIVFPSLVIDTSAPHPGQVWCPSILHTRGHMKCSWDGYFDEEGPITGFKLFIGSKENEADLYISPDIPAHNDCFEIKVDGLSLKHNFKYYVTIEAINSVGLKSSVSSQPVLIDNTPPVAGAVVELLPDTFIHLNDAENNSSASYVDINDHDAVCVDSLSHLEAAWEPFNDPETRIVRYEVAVGNVPFGTQVKQFVEVPAERTKFVVSNIDLSRENKIFVTVRGYNEAGLFTSVSSNGAHISRLSQGFPPLYPVSVRDGRGHEDRDFQTSLGQLGATWDFSGYPCPFKSYEWAIRRIDGKEVQPFTDVGEQQFGTNSELDMIDGETYYVIVRGTNMLGLTVTARSDGITVQRDPLIPGHVFDGPFFGTDIMYQQSTQVLHASWLGFGQREEFANVLHTGNDEVVQSGTTDQTVDYYEVAVGTDRSSAKTRDNVVPFTIVGRNTSYVFENLSLQPRSAVYYITVRAHSVSYASTEVSSNGITTGIDSEVTAGEIDTPEFVNSLNTVDIQWSGFRSSLGIKFYYVGIADISNTPFPQIECKRIISNDDYHSTFRILPLESTNLDTYKKASRLHLIQLGIYVVFVFGIDEAGECNSTSKIFTVDTSPPLTGKMKTGPFFDVPLDYTTVKDELQVWWLGFDDPESRIAHTRIQLLSASSCEDIESKDVVIDWIQLDGNFTEYRFVDITLLEEMPYFVELEVTNNAGGRTPLRSSPILFDDSVPVAGKVVDGSDYQQDARYHGDTTTISGSFLHLANPQGASCPLELANFADTKSWNLINMDGLWNMDGVLWDIWYLPEQVSVSGDELRIAFERDVRKPRVLSGGYATKAHILRGGHYEVEILAASGDINAITSVVFWDGSDNTVGGFQKSDQGRRLDDCACCYKHIENNTCLCDCNDLNDPTNISSSSSEQNQTESPRTLFWEVDSGSDHELLTHIKAACGLHLIPAENNSQAVLWCRYENDRYTPMSVTLDLLYDPSEEWHNYGLVFTSSPTDVNQMHWKLDLYIDGLWKCELDGIPEMSDSAKLVLHVWNKENLVPILEDVFHPPASTARFRVLRLPPAPSNLCRYGDPFRGGSSPVVEYRAGVGTEPGTDDIVPFSTLVKPCVPCDGQCAQFHCDNECQEDVIVQYDFTLTNLSLPESTLTDNITAPIFLNVESKLGNGHSVTASSNGIIIDTSPPILDYMFYMDDAQGEFQPVNYQSSNTTIKAYWNFIDEDSEIAKNLWAIGSFPGGTDLQDFASVGFEQMGTNKSMEGLLLHNHTYYVTLRGINGAGIAKTINCPGVTVLISSPLPDGVNTTVLFSEKLPEHTYPPNSLKTTDSQHVGVEWSKADDDAVTRYEYCVGSSSDAQDDIVECIPVGTNSSGSVTISDGGEVNIGSESGEAKLNMTQFPLSGDINSTDVNRSSARLNLEPGKTLVNTVRLCNSAGLCSTVQSSETTIIPEGDSLVQSSEGENINVTSSDDNDSLRRKRSLGAMDYMLDIRTTGGLHKGGSVVFGYLKEERLQQVYDSDTVTSYRSYIVNPDNTLYKTSRLLRKRILNIYEPSFYLTSLGQVELNGPLQVNVTLPLGIMNVSESYPSLLFWNPDKQEWQEAKHTCTLDNTVMFDSLLSMFSVEVCNTRSTKSKYSRKRRVAQEQELTQQYFQRETQFVVAQVSKTIVNEPPILQNLVDVITIKEDQGTIRYRLQATDPDGDVVKFYLDPLQPGAKNGDVSVTPDGLFTYTPCLDCYGEDNITIVAEEVQSSEEIYPLSRFFSLLVVISQEEDEPVLFVVKNGEVVGTSREVFMTTEEKTPRNGKYQPLSFVVGAFDVDDDENLDIEIRDISNGYLDMIEESRYKLKDSAESECDQHIDQGLSNENQLTNVPCGLEIPKGPTKLTWLMRQYSYTPLTNRSGVDELQIIARDKYGLISRHLTIHVGILTNPCIHGKCKGPYDNITCADFRRSFSFDGYVCECDDGYFGDVCQFQQVNDAPGFVPESTNVDLIIILIISLVIITAMISVVIAYRTKRRKGFYAFDVATGGNDNLHMDIFAVRGSPKNKVHPFGFDNGMATDSDQEDDDNIRMDIFAPGEVRTEQTETMSAEITKQRNDDILENTAEVEKTHDTFQEPLHPIKTTVNVAALCSKRFYGEEGIVAPLPKVD